MADLQPPAPSIKVEQVAEIYQQKKNCGDKEKRQGLTTWTEFVKVIRQLEPVKTIRDLQQRHNEHYHDWIHEQLDRKWTAETIKRRFANIRTQLRYALRRSSDKEQVRRVLDLTALFETPTDHNGTNPQPIAVDDFKKLLKASRQTPTVDADLWECLLLMSVNFCFYPIDLAGLKPEHIKDETLVYRRKKTGVMRVGVFWKRTTKALRSYQTKHPHG